MIITQQGLDNWFAKGFETLCSYILTRSRENHKTDESSLYSLEKGIDKIKLVLNYPQWVISEDEDFMMFTALDLLTQLMVQRCFRSRMYSPEAKEKFLECQQMLAKALRNLKEKI